MATSSVVVIYIILTLVTLYVLTKVKEMRLLFIRQCSYDAVAYSTEYSQTVFKQTGVRLTSKEKLREATLYLKMDFPFMSWENAEKRCRSILAKTSAVGATGAAKV